MSVFIIITLLNTVKIESTQTASVQPSQASAQKEFSCVRPASYEDKLLCKNQEQKILAATIRIELHTWATFGGHHKTITTKSHATILDGIYLVTHNHYKYSLTEQAELFSEEKGYTAISLRTANGRLMLEEADLTSFRIAYADAETLVLAFMGENDRGLFEAANLPSAQFVDKDAIQLQAGDELAQIDWNGETAHVDWVRVDNLSLTDEVPQMQVDNFPKKGCPGGGVFLNGVHIGNNWAKNIAQDLATDEITRRYSIIALNTAAVVELAQ